MLRVNERLDQLQRNGYEIIQDPNRFCFGIDAVLLSDFAKAKKGDRVLDLGTGTGILPILIEAKTQAENFVALEIQADSVDMARRSVEHNKLTDKIEVVQGDIKEAVQIFGQDSFDVVVTNPPYMSGQQGVKNPSDAKAIARHEILCNLEDVISQTSRVLKVKGHFYMVHRPNRLADIMSLMRQYNLEPKTLRLVQPYVDKEANMLLIEGIKGAGVEMKVLPNLIVYNEDGTYTQEIYDIYGYEE